LRSAAASVFEVSRHDHGQGVIGRSMFDVFLASYPIKQAVVLSGGLAEAYVKQPAFSSIFRWNECQISSGRYKSDMPIPVLNRIGTCSSSPKFTTDARTAAF